MKLELKSEGGSIRDFVGVMGLAPKLLYFGEFAPEEMESIASRFGDVEVSVQGATASGFVVAIWERHPAPAAATA